MINATQIRSRMILVVDGGLYRVLNVNHVTPGKGNAIMQTELRDIRSGTKIEKRFRPSEAVERAFITTHEMEYLYQQNGKYHFMNSETYEQIELSEALLGSGVYYLKPNTKIMVDFYENEAVGIELPDSVELVISETEPPMKGATAAGSGKPARLDNGITVKVPPYMKVGDRVRVNPDTNEFIERA